MGGGLAWAGRAVLGVLLALLLVVVVFAVVKPLTRLVAVGPRSCEQLALVATERGSVDPCRHTPTLLALDQADREAIGDARDTLLRLGLAPIAGGAAYLTWRRTRALEVATTTGGHAVDDELYAKAIEQIGHGVLTIRLGGLFALEQLAIRSPARYATNVYEVLVAHLREHLPKVPGPVDPEPPTEIAAVRNILTRNSELFDNEVPWLDGEPLANSLHLCDVDLSDRSISGLDMSNARLSGVALLGSELTLVEMDEAVLNDVALDEAALKAVALTKARLERVSLCWATLEDVMLDGANLLDCDLGGSSRNGVDDVPETMRGSVFDQNTDWAGIDLLGLGARDTGPGATPQTNP